MERLTIWTSIPCLKKVLAAARRHRRGSCRLLCLSILLLAAAGGRPTEIRASAIARDTQIGGPRPGAGEPADLDPVYDHFLQRFRPLRANAARRRYLAAEVVTAASQNRIDPDLLFALVAVESSFDSAAVSTKGARGLGQIMFPTARMVAPTTVRSPHDLDSVPRNLHVTALHLRRLLIERGGDLWATLIAYNAGSAIGHLPGRDENRYVARICTYFASLKARREYREMMIMTSGDAGAMEN